MVEQILVAGLLMFLSWLLWWSFLHMYALTKFKDDHLKALDAYFASKPYNGVHFSCVQTGMDMSATRSRLTHCKPVYTIIQKDLLFLGYWWKM